MLLKKLLVLALLVALCAWAYRSIRVRPEAPDGAPELATAPWVGAGQPGVGSAPAGLSSESVVRERQAGGGRAATGSLIAQVVEVDGCLDPTGSELILSREGVEYRTPIGADGGATFSGVRFESGATRFRLRTAVADRKCFPESFSIVASDLSGSPPSAGVSVALVHLHLLRGLVRDASSRASIAGAILEVDSFEFSSTSSDAQGAFQLNLPEPRGTLIVTARGYQELLWHFPEQAGLGPWLPDLHDFDLLPDRLTSWLRITAVDEQGRPAAGARLDLMELSSLPVPQQALAGLTSDERVEFLERLEGEVNAFGRLQAESGSSTAGLDEHGSCLIKVFLPGEIRVTVYQGTAVASARRTVLPGRNERLDLILRPGVGLTVRTVNQGLPVARVPLLITSLDNNGRSRAVSDERGAAQFEGLIPGDDVVLELDRAAPEAGLNWSCSSRRVQLPERRGSAPVVELELRPEQRVEFRGLVADALTGEAVEAHLVPKRVGAEPGRVPTATNSLGRFRLRASPGDRLLVVAEGFRERVLELPSRPERAIEILLEPLREGDTALDLSLVDERGQPQSDCRVSFDSTILSSVGRVLARQAVEHSRAGDNQGRVRHSLRLNPGERLRLVVSAGSRSGGLVGRARFELDAGQLLGAELTLDAAREISGRIEWPDGGPARSGIQVGWWEAEEVGGSWTTGRTDDQGRFRLGGLTEGSGRLVVQGGLNGALLEFELPAAGRNDLVVRLEPLRELDLRVVDSSSRVPLIWAAALSAFESSGTRDMTVVVPATGRVRVRISAPGYRPRTVEISGRPDSPGPIEVALQRAW